jgi:hypothetical protein
MCETITITQNKNRLIRAFETYRNVLNIVHENSFVTFEDGEDTPHQQIIRNEEIEIVDDIIRELHHS